MMEYQRDFPWERVNDYLLASGAERDPRMLCVAAVKKISALIPYDQGRIYFINDNGKVYDDVLFGVDKRWNRAYLEYYSQVEGGRYSIEKLSRRSVHSGTPWRLRNWAKEERGEFLEDYIKPQGIVYSLGFGLRDANFQHKCSVSLDRTHDKPFSEREVTILQTVLGHLENLHKNLYVQCTATANYVNNFAPDARLTPREREITRLLCDGVGTEGISNKLCLSRTTVYKHIANIHAKLQVSSRQELLLRVLSDSSLSQA
ncbi:MAG: helix-turn-helix transcriptional regulator [Lachnospiraceae bacterium]|jgi:DNA-binding CsgD family transcriptional regulator|nr:helix-turn-helix transcriptional regulator [Lachnospiraceae bacterium]